MTLHSHGQNQMVKNLGKTNKSDWGRPNEKEKTQIGNDQKTGPEEKKLRHKMEAKNVNAQKKRKDQKTRGEKKLWRL